MISIVRREDHRVELGTGYSSPAHPHGLGHGYYLAEPLDEKAMGELLVPVA